MTSITNYYQAVVEVTQEYLGPAAERFVNRQMEFYLNKQSQTLTKADVIKLKDALRIALSLLMDDQADIDEAVNKLDQITKR